MKTYTWKNEIVYWTCITLACVIVATTIFFGVRWGHRFRVSLERAACERWGEAVELETKFLEIRFLGYDCFAYTENGWVDKNNLIQIKEQ